MTPNDIFGIGLFGGFGLWWLAAPRSVTVFYIWLSRGKAKLPRPLVIRIVGAAWFLLVVAVVIFDNK